MIQLSIQRNQKFPLHSLVPPTGCWLHLLFPTAAWWSFSEDSYGRFFVGLWTHTSSTTGALVWEFPGLGVLRLLDIQEPLGVAEEQWPELGANGLCLAQGWGKRGATTGPSGEDSPLLDSGSVGLVAVVAGKADSHSTGDYIVDLQAKAFSNAPHGRFWWKLQSMVLTSLLFFMAENRCIP